MCEKLQIVSILFIHDYDDDDDTGEPSSNGFTYISDRAS